MIFLYVVLVLCAFDVQCQKMKKILDPSELKQFYNNVLSNIQTNINFTNYEISAECEKDVLETIAASRKGEIWALQMLDATSKIQSGFIEGNIINLGAYDQCLSIHNKLEDREIKGKYCFYGIIVKKIPKNFIRDFPEYTQYFDEVPLMEAICIPDSCSAADLAVAFNSTGVTGLFGLEPIFLETTCQVKNQQIDFTFLHGLFLFLVCGDIFLMTICTSYDIYLRRTHNKPYHKCMISFSLYTNIMQLIKLKKDPDQLSCINGIRTLSMAWIVLGHRYMLMAIAPHFNYVYTVDWAESKQSLLATGALFAVDTFFVISGCLVFYIVLLAKAMDFKFNLFHYFIHRIFRLSPSIVMLMLFYMTYLKNISVNSGPLWPIIYKIFVGGCETSNWWQNLFFVQNTIRVGHVCILHTWYLAVDTQLFYLAPILFIPLQRWPKPTLAAILLLLLGSIIYGFITAWDMETAASYLALEKSYSELYANTIVRSNAWFIGTLLGYALYLTRGKKVVINKYIVILLWILSIGFMSWMVYLQYYFTTANYNRFNDSFYLTISKPVWSLGLAWIIFACVRGYSGFLEAFLSNRLFIIIGRLSYSMYLLHIVVIYYSLCNMKTMTYFTAYNTFYIYWGDLFYTMCLSVIWSLAFESPIIALGKAFMEPEMAKRLEEIDEENETAYKNQQNNDIQFVTRL